MNIYKNKPLKIFLLITIFTIIVAILKVDSIWASFLTILLGFLDKHYKDFNKGMTFIENDAEYCHLVSR